MVQRYIPKIKADTAKNIAKNMLATSGGKKISDTRFKNFLKQNKDLKQYVYAAKNTTYAKHQAKKFFNKVMESAQSEGKLKISHAAKKMGIRINKQGQVSNIGLDKIYNKASTEELASQPQDKGPSKDEIRRQKRHEEAIKTMHKRERADEIQKDQQQSRPAENRNQSQNKRVTSPISSSGASGTTPAIHGQTIQSNFSNSVQTGAAAAAPIKLISLLILPLNNLSVNVEGLDWITKKIGTLIKQVIASLRMFNIVNQEKVNQALNQLHFEKIPEITEENKIRLLTENVGAQVCLIGTVKKIGPVMEIYVHLLNLSNKKKLIIVNLKEESDDIFNLERKISWQITNTFQSDFDDNADLPSTKEVTELPI